MSDFSNSAVRVLNYINKVQSQPDNLATATVWAKAFGLDESKAKADPHDVMGKLTLLRAEVDFIEASMKSTTFSENLYKPHIAKIRKTVTVSNITANWSSYKPQLSPDTLLSLRFCSEIMEHETSIPIEELEKLLSKIADLKNEVETGSLSNATSKFILSQINIIETAIHDYPIKGGSSIKQAFKDGFSDLAEKADELSGNEDLKSTCKLGKIWKSLNSVGKGFVEADRIANTFISLIDKGQALSEMVLSLPGIGS